MKAHLRPGRRSNLFFATDCGCSGSAPSTGNATPVFPSTGYATICDDRYFQLPTTAQGRVLIVMPGSNCQVFLKAPADGEGTPLPGFLWINESNVVYGNRTPALTLPIVNPAVGGNYPATGTFSTLMVSASGAAPHAWQMFMAPSSGQYLLQTDNGVFRFVDAGAIPGLTTVCAGTTVSKVSLMGCAVIGTNGNGDPIYGVRKLTPANERVVVGTIPTNGDPSGFIVLPDGTPLRHPLMEISNTLRPYKFKHLKADGTVVTDGLPQYGAFGVNAVTDLWAVQYSPTTGQFSLRASPVAKTVHNNNSTRYPASGNLATSYTLPPDNHCASGSVAIHYKNVFISAAMFFNASEDVDWALFMDGVMVVEYQTDTNTTNRILVNHVLNNVTPGDHTFDVRVKRRSGGTTGATNIRHSSISVITLPF